MSNKTIHQLYREHEGKVSDKWTLYLSEYERLFTDYRDKPVRLLEIGIQNGGSLDIWSRYFSKAAALIGCDINPDCACLNYDDPRIGLVIGDANAPEVRKRVLQRSSEFDIIIDDGSHLSSDIIKSFALYFPRIAEGGVFIAEDLHCSYWSQFKGGLFDPYSSISFFKRLADIISHEHWGIPKLRADILRGIFTKYGCEIDEESLAQVHSVEFLNSMCVVRKALAADNRLGRRFIAGSMELVVPNSTVMWPHDKPYQFDPTFDQSGNPRTARTIPPDEAIEDAEVALVNARQHIVELSGSLTAKEADIVGLSQILGEREKQLASLGITLSERDSRVANLSQTLGEREKQIASLGITLSKRDTQVASLSQIVQDYQDSTSWRITKPVRFVGRFIRRVKKSFEKRFVDPFLGNTKISRTNELSHLRFHIDNPSKRFNKVDGDLVVSGWCVDIDAKAVANVRVRRGKAIYHASQQERVDVQRAFESVCKIPLDCGFGIVHPLPIGLHRIWIDIKGSDGTWMPVKRVLVLRLPQKIFCSYKTWARIEQKRLKTELPEIKRHIDVMIQKPMFTIVIDTRQSLNGWRASLQSICKQIYPHHEVRTLGNSGTRIPTLLKQAAKPLDSTSLIATSGDFIIFIECGQRLSSNALYEFANAINQDPDLDLIYGDEDHLNASLERCNPFYKPDWSPDYLETFNYIGFTACFRTTLARGCFDSAHLYDLTLKFTELTAKIRHVAKILGHQAERKMDEDAVESTSVGNIKALHGRLMRTGRQGIVREHKLHRGCYDIQIKLKREPLVSVIIPTAGKMVTVTDRQIDLITNITHQIRKQSTYKNIEIIVVDNGDLSEDQQQTLSDQGCRLITFTEPIFNISKKLNLGASIANGELLLLMNDDIEIILPSWIERMVEHFEKPHVGVVGAKLLYPDGLTQHVGVVHNYGNPDHVSRLQPKEDAGYYFSTCGNRNFMAVTGAVMMTLSNTYRLVGGYSTELAVSFNDIDYCLKVRDVGLWIVYAAKAELIHMESLSCVRSADMGELSWYHKRWARQLTYDPYYNEKFLSVARPTFTPCNNQRLL